MAWRGSGSCEVSRGAVVDRVDEECRDARSDGRWHGGDRVHAKSPEWPWRVRLGTTVVAYATIADRTLVAVQVRDGETVAAMTDLATLDLIDHAALVRSGQATALELLDAAIARIESARSLNAVICELFDRARAQASGPLGDGPLAGAPFLLKDLGASLAGVPERMGSVALRDHVSTATPVVVARYLAA